MVERVQRISHHQPHAGECRVQPVDRRLTGLEVVQVDPASLHTVHTGHPPGHTPIGVLDPRIVEDHPLQPADDVPGLLQPLLGLRSQIHGVLAGRNLGQQPPVLPRDLGHVVNARIVADVHLGQPEVGPLTRVPGHDVVDHDAAVRCGNRAQPAKLLLRPERLVDVRADPIELTVDAGRDIPS